ncbi:MAG: MoxR family ATPase [Dermatophilaceae bacterium]
MPSPGDASAAVFASVDDARQRLESVGYFVDRSIATTVFVQGSLLKPLLLEGPAGVGKTDLAVSLAAATGRTMVRLQCYEGQDETKALYEWDYGKQLLYTQVLREKIGELLEGTRTLDEAVARISEHDSVFFSPRFLAHRPLLQAIVSEDPVVLLIDEIDRADEGLEAVLLELLAEFQVSIPELGTMTARHTPLVVLTSNNTRDLSAALKRRCLHLFLDYPDADRELEIVRSKHTGLDDSLARQLVDVVRELRTLDLRKPPSISETVDWAATLAVLGASELSAQLLSDTVNSVVKYERDVDTVRAALRDWTDPNRLVATTLPGHGHSHGHSHSHEPGHEHSHDDDHEHPHEQPPLDAPPSAGRPPVAESAPEPTNGQSSGGHTTRGHGIPGYAAGRRRAPDPAAGSQGAPPARAARRRAL